MPHHRTHRQRKLNAKRRDVRTLYSGVGKTGAGEAIRTLDPNLGKVVLYP